MTPPNLVKHVAKATSAPAPVAVQAAKASTGALEFSQLAARYRRAPISEAEMEAIEVSTKKKRDLSFQHAN